MGGEQCHADKRVIYLGGKQYTSVAQCIFGDTAIRIAITLQGKMPGICFGCNENEIRT